jgi:cephalosporin hydroxylase
MRSTFRQLFGEHIDRWNLYLPMGHYLPYLTEIFCNSTKWKGVTAIKNPLDAWIYQEIIHETKPDIIIEIGNQNGGSTWMLRDFGPKVIAIDIDHSRLDPRVKEIEGITWVTGDATDIEIYQQIIELIPPGSRVMVIDDSAHTEVHTYNILLLYSPLVTIGCYFIVEDTDTNHLIKFEDERPDSPLPAVLRFASENQNWEIDRDREKFWVTSNPQGYLKRLQ